MLEHELCCCVAFHPPSSVLRRTTATPPLFPVYLDGHIHAKRTARVHSHAPARKTIEPSCCAVFLSLTRYSVACFVCKSLDPDKPQVLELVPPVSSAGRPGFNALQYSPSR